MLVKQFKALDKYINESKEYLEIDNNIVIVDENKFSVIVLDKISDGDKIKTINNLAKTEIYASSISKVIESNEKKERNIRDVIWINELESEVKDKKNGKRKDFTTEEAIRHGMLYTNSDTNINKELLLKVAQILDNTKVEIEIMENSSMEMVKVIGENGYGYICPIRNKE